MKYLPGYTLFLIFIFYSSCGQNQTNLPPGNISKVPYTRFQIEEADTASVPSSMVRNIKQAKNGDILIASWLGVFRFDGKTFTDLTSNIPMPSFWDVLEDKKGNLWLATRDSGVYHYDGKLIQHFTTSEGLANNGVRSVYEDSFGNIWFGTGGGLSCYDGRSFRNFTMKEGLSHNDITNIMEDNTGKLWIGTRAEPCFYDGKTFTVFKNNDDKAFNNVWSIIEDKKGNIWLGDDEGLWRSDGRSCTKVSQRRAYAIIQDKQGNIWTTGEVKMGVWALIRYNAKSLYNKDPIITEIVSGGPALLALLEAYDGSIWFGGLGSMSGVFRYDGKTITDFKRKVGQ